MAEVRFGPELLTRLLDHLVGQLAGCLGAGVSTWGPESTGNPLCAVGLAEELDERQRAAGAGPLVTAGREESLVTSADLGADERWPELAEHAGVGVLAVPASWNDDGPVLLTCYLDRPPTVDDLRVVEQVEPLLSTAAAVLEFCAGEVMRADQMLNLVRYRRVIEQAKGLVMAQQGCLPGTAFRVLVRASQQFNVKLRDLAAALVEQACGAPADEPEDELALGAREAALAQPSEVAVLAAKRVWTALQRPPTPRAGG